jgi:Nucleotidyl transferase of unknown function (DUF2204)
MEHTFDLLEKAVSALTSVFNKKKIKYVLIGGQAVSRLTRPRYTKDLDFLIDIPQMTLPGLLEEINELGGDADLLPSIKAWNQNHMLMFHFKDIRVDWLKPVIPAYAHVIQHGTPVDLNGQIVNVASAEGLILLKLLANRTQDQVDVESLISTKRDSLNLAWIDSEWQTIGELTDPPMVWFKEKYQLIVNS